MLSSTQPLKFAPLREELALMPGPATPQGHPTWTLHDPARNLFFQLDWPSFEILSRWSTADAEAMLQAIRKETTLQVDASDLERVVRFVTLNQLTQPGRLSSSGLAQTLAKRKGSVWTWLLHNYLYFRIPLVHPDAWLERTLPWVGYFYSRRFLQLTVVAGVLGLVSIHREWERYASTLVHMLSWEGMLAYGLTLSAVKVLHELGHGFTAKRFGCHVPTMGAAFLVLWPVAYTDTNEVWMLTDRRQRLMVGAAGIVVELMIAAWATLLWMWLPEGELKTAAFLLSSTTWVSTLAINASPFMRFDGYFLVSDYWRMPNLHARSFALARWDLRERLFGLGLPRPEQWAPVQHRVLIAFAWAVWIYRLVLFLGIAVLVYHFFIKAVGIALFLVEIVWFVSLPIWQELRLWQTLWPRIRASDRGRRTMVVSFGLMVLFLVPLPIRIVSSGLLYPESEMSVYAPAHAQLKGLPHVDQGLIKAGSVVLEMDSPEIRSRIVQSAVRSDSLAWQSAAAIFDADLRKSWQVLNAQWIGAQAEQSAAIVDGVNYAPIALMDGIFRDLDPDLQPGQWLVHRELLGRVIQPDRHQVVTYVDDDGVQRLHSGASGVFLADGGAGPNVSLTVVSIDKDATKILREGELASLFGASIAVREKNGLLYPERPVYRVILQAKDDTRAAQHKWRGRVSIAADMEPLGLRFLRHALSVFWREAGF